MNNHVESNLPIAVDMDSEAIEYHPIDSWIARVGGLPSCPKEASTPQLPSIVCIFSPHNFLHSQLPSFLNQTRATFITRFQRTILTALFSRATT